MAASPTSHSPVTHTDLQVLLMSILSLGHSTSLLVPRPSVREMEHARAKQKRSHQDYVAAFRALPARRRQFANNLTDCFIGLARYASYEVHLAANDPNNPIPGIDLKIMLEDLVDALVQRGIHTCRQVNALAQISQSHERVERSDQLKHFRKDVAAIKSALDSRRVHARQNLLTRYASEVEMVVTYIGGDRNAEALLRKIRTVLGPTHAVAPQTIHEVAVPASEAAPVDPAQLEREIQQMAQHAEQIHTEAVLGSLTDERAQDGLTDEG
jgi:hypothetical protein